MPERRGKPRWDFDGVIELRDLASGKKVLSVASNLSQSGCRVSTTTPFKKGAKVELSIRHGGTALKAAGKVVYSKDHTCMGIRFNSLSAAEEAIVREWAAEAGASPWRGPTVVIANRFEAPRHVVFLLLCVAALATATLGLLAFLHRL